MQTSSSKAASSSDTRANLKVEKFSYRESGRFHTLVCDYLEGQPDLLELVEYSPDLAGIAQAMEKLDLIEYPRAVLADGFRRQYASLTPHIAVQTNLEALEQGAHMIVTAHQLNLFGAPLYWMYKTISAIALARKLEREFPSRKFIPVFYLGGEDHDLAEIDHFKLFGKNIRWDREPEGPTGLMNLEGMDQVYAQLSELLGDSAHDEELRELFKTAYLQGGTLSDAQTRLLHELFGVFGLLVFRPEDPILRRAFNPIVQRELETPFALNATKRAIELLDQHWHVQAMPRDLNLFYSEPGLRERIERDGDGFVLSDSSRRFSAAQMAELLESDPNRFSPNVVLRPLLQQCLLPALVFIGGGSELAYWLQLKELFKQADVFMPVLMLRNSVLWVDAASAKKWRNLDLELGDLFEDEDALLRRWVDAHEPEDLSLKKERENITAVYAGIAAIAQDIDASLLGKVEAEKAAQLNALDKLSQRLIKAGKQKHEIAIGQIRKTLGKCFPDGGFQERSEHFGMLWVKHGADIRQILLEQLDPLDPRFTVIEEG